jgi:hypothetical protein
MASSGAGRSAVCAPDGRLCGILTDGDIRRALLPALLLEGEDGAERASERLLVADAMTRIVVAAAPDDPAESAAALARRFGIRELPVVDPEGRVAGIFRPAERDARGAEGNGRTERDEDAGVRGRGGRPAGNEGKGMGEKSVLLGTAAGDHVALRIVARAEQSVRDFWDTNWLSSVVEVSVGGFRGKNGAAWIRAEELLKFRKQLERMSARQIFEAELLPLEPHLQLRLRPEPDSDRIAVLGTLADRVGSGCTLTFRFLLEGSLLETLIAQLRAVEEEFPTAGGG